MRKILIVEDNKDVCIELKSLFEKNGYQADYLEDFKNAVEQILEYDADLVLLDINLPYVDGQNILREVRKKSNVLIMMVTSNDTEMDELLCMSFGADDFVSKPYNPAILLLHIEAMFKRLGAADNSSSNIVKYEDMTVDVGRCVIQANGTNVELSKNEMKILSYLLNNRGNIISRDKLMDYLWEMEEFVDDNTLTVNINRLRKKLEQVGYKDVIKTKRGLGYLIG